MINPTKEYIHEIRSNHQRNIYMKLDLTTLTKQFVLEEDFILDSGILLNKGMKFSIKKIEGEIACLKHLSTIEECEPAIQNYAKRIKIGIEGNIKVLEKVIEIWEKEEGKFIPKADSYFNAKESINEYKGGHCIHTGYNEIPEDHKDKYGMAKSSPCLIMTLDYEHIEGKNNIYPYQGVNNTWYSKETYEYMRLGKLAKLEEYGNPKTSKKKEYYKIITGENKISLKQLQNLELSIYEDK